MRTIKNILVPTNLSVSSLSVVQYALHQFKGYSFNITLLHVLPLPDSITDLLLISRNAESAEQVPHEFHTAIARLKLLFPLRLADVNIEFQYGLSASILSEIITNKEIDLILHCKTSFRSPAHSDEHKLLKLLDESVYPVVYVPETPATDVPKNISFVLEEGVDCVQPLKEMLEHLHIQPETELRLIAAMKIDKAAKLMIQFKDNVEKGKLFGLYRFSMHMLQGENYEESIMQFTEDFNVDMIFLLKKKTFLNRYFINQHILNQTLKQSRIPLFTLA